MQFNSISKILQANCISRTKGDIPIRQLWLNRLFTDLANSHEKNCLTTDCGCINQNGPGRFRTKAENPEKQVCYFAKPNDDKFYNTFLSRHIKGDDFGNKVYFQIEKLRNKDGLQTFSAKKTLENGSGSVGCTELQSREHFGYRTKQSAEADEHFFRRDRKSARPRFLHER